jgi:hypothetical protein
VLDRIERYLDTFYGDGITFEVQGSPQLYVWPGMIIEWHEYLDMRTIEPRKVEHFEYCRQVQVLLTILDLYKFNMYHERIFENAKLTNKDKIIVKLGDGRFEIRSKRSYAEYFLGFVWKQESVECPEMIVSDPSMLRKIEGEKQGCLYLQQVRERLPVKGTRKERFIRNLLGQLDRILEECGFETDERESDLFKVGHN